MDEAPRPPILLLEPLPDGGVLRSLLEDDGHTVETVADPEAALALLRERPFDVLVAAAEAEGRGLDLLARACRVSQDTPVVLMGVSADVAAKAFVRGAAGFLVPPIEAGEARACFAHARRRRGLDRQRLATLEEARGTRRFFEDVLRGLGEGILVIDAQGKIRFLNAEAARIVGEDDELPGPAPSGGEGGEGSSTQRKYRALAPLLQLLVDTITDREAKAQMLVVEEEEDKLFLDATTSVLREGDGRTTGAVAIVRDRSAEKVLEAQLVHTERLATLGSLLASIAHEISNPLSVITGAAEVGVEAAAEAEEVAKKTADKTAQEALWRLSRDVRDILEQVREAGLRCHTISQNLLQYSRRAPAHVREEDLNELVNRTLAFVGKYLGTDRVETLLELDAHLPRVRLDASQFQQALTNLVDNAVQAMLGEAKRAAETEGEVARPVKLRIRTEVKDGQATVVVADSGPGIPPARLEHIWRPFYTTKARGTGLGLYITRKAIENQGGTISVESHVGRGTTFTLRFPL